MTLRATLPPPHDQGPGPVSGAQLSGDIGDTSELSEDLRDVDTESDLVPRPDAGGLGDRRGPGQPQGEAQGQVQDQEEQQQRGAPREAEGKQKVLLELVEVDIQN